MEYRLAKIAGRKEERREDSDNDGNDGEHTSKQRKVDLEMLLSGLRRSFLIGKEIAVHTADGYHYGILQGVDEDFIYLTDYVFDKQKLSVFEYSARAGFNRGVVPREKMKAMSEIPLVVEKEQKNASFQ